MDKFLEKYFVDFNKVLSSFLTTDKNKQRLNKAVNMLKNTREIPPTIYLIGNDGSSAIAEHMAIDLTKNARLRARAISGSPMLTTFSNYYEF